MYYLWKQINFSHLTVLILMILVRMLDIIYLPYLFSRMVAESSVTYSVVYRLIISMATITFSYRICQYITYVHTATNMNKKITNEAMDHLLKTQFRYLHSPEEQITKIGFLNGVNDIFAFITWDLVPNTVAIVFLMAILLRKSYILFILVFIWVLSIILGLFLMSQIRYLGEMWAEISVNNIAKRINVLRNFINVKLFSSFRQEQNINSKHTEEEFYARRRFEVIMYAIWSYIWIIYLIMVCGLIWILYSRFTVSDFVWAFGCVGQIANPVAGIMVRWSEAMQNLSKIKDGLSIFDIQTDSAIGKDCFEDKESK